MSAPLTSRLLIAALPHLSPDARRELASGHVGARIVRHEVDAVLQTTPLGQLGVRLTRDELRRAAWSLGARRMSSTVPEGAAA